MEQNKLKHIASMFQTSAAPARVEPMGAGLINDTYRVVTEAGDDAPPYVLHRLHHPVD